LKDLNLNLFTDMKKHKLSEREANNYSPLSLAFLGDSVYDTLIREYLLRMGNMPVSKLHSAKIRLVCAEYQSEIYGFISDFLTEHEMSVMKRGRNASGNTVPKHADPAQYHRATGLECLFGYLYITGQEERINELFRLISENIHQEE